MIACGSLSANRFEHVRRPRRSVSASSWPLLRSSASSVVSAAGRSETTCSRLGRPSVRIKRSLSTSDGAISSVVGRFVLGQRIRVTSSCGLSRAGAGDLPEGVDELLGRHPLGDRAGEDDTSRRRAASSSTTACDW